MIEGLFAQTYLL